MALLPLLGIHPAFARYLVGYGVLLHVIDILVKRELGRKQNSYRQRFGLRLHLRFLIVGTSGETLI